MEVPAARRASALAVRARKALQSEHFIDGLLGLRGHAAGTVLGRSIGPNVGFDAFTIAFAQCSQHSVSILRCAYLRHRRRLLGAGAVCRSMHGCKLAPKAPVRLCIATDSGPGRCARSQPCRDLVDQRPVSEHLIYGSTNARITRQSRSAHRHFPVPASCRTNAPDWLRLGKGVSAGFSIAVSAAMRLRICGGVSRHISIAAVVSRCSALSRVSS